MKQYRRAWLERMASEHAKGEHKGTWREDSCLECKADQRLKWANLKAKWNADDREQLIAAIAERVRLELANANGAP